MNGRRAIVGLCMLCALLASAFAAQSASAITGTTAVTCKAGAGDTGGATFDTAHCLPGEAAGGFGHYKIAEGTATELTGQAGSETTKLKALVGGVQTTFTSTELTGTGTVENKVEVGGANAKEHYTHFTGTIIYQNVTISPFTKCFVYTDEGGLVGAQGVVDTVKLTATTTGQGDALKFTPDTGTVFARFWILDKNKKTSGEGGECAISGTFSVSGSVIATPEGATATTTHAKVTEQNTLKMGTGEPTIKAGIEGSVTFEGRDAEVCGGGAYNPLSFTTYST